MDVPAFQNNEKRQTTGAFLSSLPIICRFSFLGHCPSFSALLHFWGIAPALPLSSISGAIQLMPKNLKF